MPLVPLQLRTHIPCHKRAIVFLPATPYVPIERYERRCKFCGLFWSIKRKTMQDKDGVRMDSLSWWLAEDVYTHHAAYVEVN